MDPSVIVMEGIRKTFVEKGKKTNALDDLSLSVKKGSFVTLMGASGCGKSTVTKIIAGIEDFDAGRLFIDDKEIKNRKMPLETRKRIGYVFQLHNLAEWRTVEGNLFFPLEMYGEKKSDLWERRATRYLDFVGLTRYRNVFPRELSGGMKQRVGIARALMTEPDTLILDQPFGALDAITRSMISAKLYRMVREEQKTVLMVTSDIDEAACYSDIIHIMDRGRIKQSISSSVPAEHRLQDDFRRSKEYLDIKLELTRAIYSDLK